MRVQEPNKVAIFFFLWEGQNIPIFLYYILYSLLRGNVLNYILLYHFDTFYFKNDYELYVSKIHFHNDF